ncbi:hypothetical protein [Nocardioides panacisoli]|uniref:Uncharacterized protein n=1 Tax=Nocardioides panacisoli TaxID=627624 RepID=A0ABP7HRY7_9ACTN
MPPDDADPPPQRWDEYDAPGDSPGSVLLPDTPDPSSTPPPVTPMTPPSADPPPSTWVPEQTPQPFVPYGSAGGGPTIGGTTFVTLGGASGRIGSRWSLVGVILGIAGATVGVGVAIWAASGGGGIGIHNPLDKPDMHSQAGIDDLSSSLEDAGAGTKMYNLVLYPDYAVAEVAVPGGSGSRYQGYYFSGSLDGDWSDGTAPDEKTFDLSQVDGGLIGGFCDRVSKLLDSPGDCYVVVDPSETKGDKTFYQAYVSNDFTESAYVTYDADGNELSHYTS